DRVLGIFLPAHQVARPGDVRRPLSLGAIRSGVIEAVVILPSFNDLVQRDGRRIIGFRTASNDRIVLDIGPRLEVARRGQPDPLIAALVEEVPRAVLEPGGRRTIGAGAEW